MEGGERFAQLEGDRRWSLVVGRRLEPPTGEIETQLLVRRELLAETVAVAND